MSVPSYSILCTQCDYKSLERATWGRYYVPLKFITKLRNSRYAFANGKCVEYVDLYVQVKQKYGLRFIHNNINAAKAACR